MSDTEKPDSSPDSTADAPAAAPAWCWHDLATTDVDAAVAFYKELLGWQINPVPMGDFTYNMIHVAGQGIGGFVPLDASLGAPCHWTGYVATDDVDATAARAASHGGSVHVEPQDMPNIGRFAVVADPVGASFSLFKSAHTEPKPVLPSGTPGVFCWNELMTTDVAGAKAFYGEVLGWGARDVDMGDMGTYSMFFAGDAAAPQDCAGMMQSPPDAPHPPFWVHYVAVSDLAATFDRVAALGGQPFVPPTDIPGIGRFAIAADPTGATFALYQGA